MKPELMQAVLEIATKPCDDVAEAGEQLAELRRGGDRDRRAPRAWRSAPPAPTRSPHCDDQEIVDRPRYRELVDELGYDRLAAS